ncbi:14036_t:CDS:2 [Funneliformis mosseae]|uniref:14036_t:CDS:1 n=1 Tax=Funneliformis mosseae TaxID=27381 RepID=A0A9N8VYT5_FUNMO|nr:14036_t:CDS:2 [Funneliformis mosseae]
MILSECWGDEPDKRLAMDLSRAPDCDDWNRVVIIEVISTKFTSIKMAKVYMEQVITMKRHSLTASEPNHILAQYLLQKPVPPFKK